MFFVSAMLLHLNLSSAQSPSQSLQSLVSSEHAFAAATARLGVRNGFLTFFADDAITFEPAFGLYRDILEKRPLPTYPQSVLLRWAPEEGDVAVSGDIGYLTGPYSVETATPSDDPPSGGWFFSVWKKQKSNIWKVFIDVGIETPSHGIPIDSVRFVPAPSHGTGATGGTASGLSETDASLNRALAGSSPDVDALFTSSARVHRNGWFPVRGLSEIRSYLRAHPYGTASAIRAEVSRSGDLGFTYGTYENAATRGYYIRVWKFTSAETWNVVLDVTTEQK